MKISDPSNSGPYQPGSSPREVNPPAKPGVVARTGPQVPAAEIDSIDTVVARLNENVQPLQRDILFQLDERTGEAIVQVVDEATGEVIRKMPGEVALRLARDLQEFGAGSLHDTHI